MRFARFFLLILGILLFTWIIQSVGIRTLWIQTQSFGWRILIILFVYGVIFVLDTWGWHFSFPLEVTRSFRWHSLFASRLAGEALNYVTPFAALGGEPVKAKILKDRHQVPWSDSVASLVIAKTSLVLGLVLLIFSSVGITIWSSPLSNQLQWTTLGLSIFFSLLILSFWRLQQLGFARRSWALMKKWIPLAPLKKVSLFAGRRLDQKVTQFYRVHKRRFALSVFFHFLGWALGIIEVYLILRFLGLEISWGQAWVLESLFQLVKALSFFIPGALGTQEGGALLIVTELGFTSAVGLTLAIIRRFRELVWMALGLALWVYLTQPKSIPVPSLKPLPSS